MTERRTFLKRITQVLGGVFASILGLPGLIYLIDPRNRTVPTGAFKRVTRLSDLPKPVQGQAPIPTQVVIRDDRRDAWTLHPEQVVGRVWLVRHADDSIDAYTAICPHLGCSVNFHQAAERFLCPCHNGMFHLSGERVEQADRGAPNPAPRGMDALEHDTESIPGEDDDVYIRVKYENFLQGRHEKQAKT